MQHLGEVQKHLDEIRAASAKVLAVSFAEPEMAAAYQADHALPFPVASDAGRTAYQAFGVGVGDKTVVYRASALRQHLQLRRKGYKPGPHRQSDMLQLGGDFVIGRDGRLTLCHPSEAGDDRVPVGEILRALGAG